jgi:hypothetical protein
MNREIFKEVKDLTDPKITHNYLWLALDIYNEADHVKIARNIFFKITYADKKTEFLPAYRGGNQVSSLNFESKKLELLHLNTTITIEKYSQIKKLELTYISETNKSKVITIHL